MPEREREGAKGRERKIEREVEKEGQPNREKQTDRDPQRESRENTRARERIRNISQCRLIYIPHTFIQ